MLFPSYFSSPFPIKSLHTSHGRTWKIIVTIWVEMIFCSHWMKCWASHPYCTTWGGTEGSVWYRAVMFSVSQQTPSYLHTSTKHFGFNGEGMFMYFSSNLVTEPIITHNLQTLLLHQRYYLHLRKSLTIRENVCELLIFSWKELEKVKICTQYLTYKSTIYQLPL